MIVQFFVAFNNRDSKDYSDSELMGLAVETAHTEFQGQRQNWGTMPIDNQAMVISLDRLFNCLCELLVMRIVVSLQ